MPVFPVLPIPTCSTSPVFYSFYFPHTPFSFPLPFVFLLSPPPIPLSFSSSSFFLCSFFPLLSPLHFLLSPLLLSPVCTFSLPSFPACLLSHFTAFPHGYPGSLTIVHIHYNVNWMGNQCHLPSCPVQVFGLSFSCLLSKHLHLPSHNLSHTVSLPTPVFLPVP